MKNQFSKLMVVILIMVCCLFLLGCGGGTGGNGGSDFESSSGNTSSSSSSGSSGSSGSSTSSSSGGGTNWSVNQNANIIEIAYRVGTEYLQIVAFHLDSGYFRLISLLCKWGTSVVVTPSFWENTASSKMVYHQGAPVTVTWKEQGDDLLINYSGTISGLNFEGTILLNPPTENSTTATVNVATSGDINLANNPNQAFKPVMLSSMKVSETLWDCIKSFIGSITNPIAADQWLVPNPITDTVFGLKGGTSEWNQNAPTITITLPTPMPITGWVTPSSDSNGDNVSMWPASDTVLRSWSYTITASKQE